MEERQAKILEMLAANGKVLVKELAEIFEVTEDSIRKDLGNLEAEGKLLFKSKNSARQGELQPNSVQLLQSRKDFLRHRLPIQCSLK